MPAIAQRSEATYRNLSWSGAEAGEHYVKLVGKTPPASPSAGFILLFEVAG